MIRPGLADLIRAVETSLRRWLGRPDRGRWRQDARLHPEWETRCAALARWIPPGSSVLDLGAGRMALRRYLPPGCVYVPVDYLPRSVTTLVCDLNAKRPASLPRSDVVVASGILEYVLDIPRLLNAIAGASPLLLASYAVRDAPGQETWFERRRSGWVNDLDGPTLETLLAATGFAISERSEWGSQLLFKARKHPRSGLSDD